MEWSTEEPRDSGWYFFRIDYRNPVKIIRVNYQPQDAPMVFYFNGGWDWLMSVKGQFAGPLTPPRDGGEDE